MFFGNSSRGLVTVTVAEARCVTVALWLPSLAHAPPSITVVTGNRRQHGNGNRSRLCYRVTPNPGGKGAGRLWRLSAIPSSEICFGGDLTLGVLGGGGFSNIFPRVADPWCRGTSLITNRTPP